VPQERPVAGQRKKRGERVEKSGHHGVRGELDASKLARGGDFPIGKKPPL